jgi:hypothetical protein
MFKSKLIARKIRKKNADRQNKSLTASYERAKSIGIVFTLGDVRKQHIVRDFMKTLEADHKKVSVLACKPKKNLEDPHFFDYFSLEDFTFWGTPQSEQLNKFTEQPFDYLFCMDENLRLEVAYVLSHSKALARIGLVMEDMTEFFEMMFKPKDKKGIEGLSTEVLYYIKKLTHHEA